MRLDSGFRSNHEIALGQFLLQLGPLQAPAHNIITNLSLPYDEHLSPITPNRQNTVRFQRVVNILLTNIPQAHLRSEVG